MGQGMMRLSVWLGLAVVCPAMAADPGFPPKVIQTAPIRLTGQRPEPAPPGPDLSEGFQAKTIQTASIRLTGQRPEPAPPGPDLSQGFASKTITTQSIRMSGQRQ